MFEAIFYISLLYIGCYLFFPLLLITSHIGLFFSFSILTFFIRSFSGAIPREHVYEYETIYNNKKLTTADAIDLVYSKLFKGLFGEIRWYLILFLLATIYLIIYYFIK